MESNHLSPPYQSGALTTQATTGCWAMLAYPARDSNPLRLGYPGPVGPSEPAVGLEPTTFRLRNGCTTCRARTDRGAGRTLPESGNRESNPGLCRGGAAHSRCATTADPSSGSNRRASGLQPGALPSELDGRPRTRVDLRDSNPTSAWRGARSQLRYKPIRPRPENRTRYVLLPKQVGQPAPSPRMHRRTVTARGPATDGRLHAIHCGLVKERRTQGWQDSNLQHPVLETGALAVELHPLDSNEKRRLPRTGRAASARVDARRYPPRMLQRTLEQPMSSGLDGHGNLAARYDPVRIRGLPEHHGRTPWLVGAYVIDGRPSTEGFGNPNSDVRGLDHRETRQKPERLPGKRCRGGADR